MFLTIGPLYKRFLWGFFVEGYGSGINVPAACNKPMRLLADGKRTVKDVSTSAGISMQTVDPIAGAMSRNGDRFYLAEIGPSLAQGVLSTHPELGNPAFSQSGGARSTAFRLVEMTAGLAPPRSTVARQRGAHAR